MTRLKCKLGFHDYKLNKKLSELIFPSKVYRCKYCKKQKIELHWL